MVQSLHWEEDAERKRLAEDLEQGIKEKVEQHPLYGKRFYQMTDTELGIYGKEIFQFIYNKEEEDFFQTEVYARISRAGDLTEALFIAIFESEERFGGLTLESVRKNLVVDWRLTDAQIRQFGRFYIEKGLKEGWILSELGW